jgi:hypothetical protein
MLAGQRQTGDQGTLSMARAALAQGLAAAPVVVGLDINKLRQTIAYLARLYAEGEISEHTFEVSVNYACSLFIDQEVERRIQTLISEKLLGQ